MQISRLSGILDFRFSRVYARLVSCYVPFPLVEIMISSHLERLSREGTGKGKEIMETRVGNKKGGNKREVERKGRRA